MPRMLYKFPGPHQLQDGGYDYVIVDDVASALADGWHKTPAEAKAAALAPPPEPIVIPEPVSEPMPEPVSERDELVKLAESLGIQVDGRWSVARLRKEIDAKDGD